MKAAPPMSEAPYIPPNVDAPDYYLTAPSYEEFGVVADTFLHAARLHRDPLSKGLVKLKLEHEAQHGHAIDKLGGIAVPTLIVYKPKKGLIRSRSPFDIKTLPKGLDPESPEFIVSTAYPEDLSPRDHAFLDRKNLTVHDADAIAVQHGWSRLRPLSLHPSLNIHDFNGK